MDLQFGSDRSGVDSAARIDTYGHNECLIEHRDAVKKFSPFGSTSSFFLCFLFLQKSIYRHEQTGNFCDK